MWVKIVLIIIVLFFVTVLIIKRFAYFSPSYNFVAPKDNYQDIREGNLHAWYKKGTSDKVILFCHGNAGNLSYRQEKLIPFSKMGFSVLIFDYSGFGQSRGVPNEQLCYANADMFINYLVRKGYKLENIIPYGESLGGAVAAFVARKYNLPKVILESALPGVKYLIKSWYPALSYLSIIFDDFNTVSFMQGYRGKSLVMHCVNDEIVPYQTITELKSLTTKFIDMEGSHNNPIIPWEEIQKFITI
jgi:uncharacterized protein